MPKFSVPTEYLKAADLSDDEDTLLTIRSFELKDVTDKSGNTKTYWALSFDETEQKLLTKTVNGNLITTALGTNEMSEWVGQRIALYINHEVQMGRDIVDGIRVRAKKPA